MALEAKVIPVQNQISDAISVTNLRQYLDFYNVYFPKDELDFANIVRDRTPKGNLPDDLYRLWALAGIEGAWFGYASMQGQLVPYRSDTTSQFLHPTNQVALLCEMANRNKQANKIKEKWVRKLEKDDPEHAIGVWGIALSIYGGKVHDRPMMTKGEIKQDARLRCQSARPICLPDNNLNDQLVKLQVKIEDVKGQPAEHFEKKHLQNVVKALSPHLDFKDLFHQFYKL